MMDSLRVTDEASAAVAIAPRVTLDDINNAIAAKFFASGSAVTDNAAVLAAGPDDWVASDVEVPLVLQSLQLLTICVLVMRNGFTVIGKSAPASPENFNAELGRKLAYEDAVRQVWPLMGFALRDKLAKTS